MGLGGVELMSKSAAEPVLDEAKMMTVFWWPGELLAVGCASGIVDIAQPMARGLPSDPRPRRRRQHLAPALGSSHDLHRLSAFWLFAQPFPAAFAFSSSSAFSAAHVAVGHETHTPTTALNVRARTHPHGHDTGPLPPT